ncbi:hypothetical protein JMJ77_0000891 [Colletotrichum scovillei]|uniref:Uncharacterized protein n=1 Tax=Colletotrichum scovillei TaxID=1209932 RepID=A0A9P7RAI4_9PEZI|nr:hypothetical protein JMJ77_0000891 [Colletotrichum scovillei]KAG7072106.1 hypothetical protein JMJ76_0004966 [Colletotrichum scovillei]KAG7080452.1 hypothetical protein JMJ78_0007546 [Colletotrichum scovillei]
MCIITIDGEVHVLYPMMLHMRTGASECGCDGQGSRPRRVSAANHQVSIRSAWLSAVGRFVAPRMLPITRCIALI